ncbi:hypothetical protein Hsero_2273 [Herbaspirillum seropedicae SmR1]|uniref:Uncharacterized protein n=1 Tax=Herbaspirillum seropedicae (strain SmR1) TaxID=757424 RepID=D8IUB0_HERSS|nr:hypothetical protein Hsero_2273 [Herbaspirillum seropedicae SmR1]
MLVVDIRITAIDVDTVAALPHQDGLERQAIAPAQEVIEHARPHRREREVDRQQAAAIGIVDQVVGTGGQVFGVGRIRMGEMEGRQQAHLAGAAGGDLVGRAGIAGDAILLEAHVGHRLIGAARFPDGTLVQRITRIDHHIVGARLRHLVIGQRHAGAFHRGITGLVAVINGQLVGIAAHPQRVCPGCRSGRGRSSGGRCSRSATGCGQRGHAHARGLGRMRQRRRGGRHGTAKGDTAVLTEKSRSIRAPAGAETFILAIDETLHVLGHVIDVAAVAAARSAGIALARALLEQPGHQRARRGNRRRVLAHREIGRTDRIGLDQVGRQAVLVEGLVGTAQATGIGGQRQGERTGRGHQQRDGVGIKTCLHAGQEGSERIRDRPMASPAVDAAPAGPAGRAGSPACRCPGRSP